jgi:hypothetical protein
VHKIAVLLLMLLAVDSRVYAHAAAAGTALYCSIKRSCTVKMYWIPLGLSNRTQKRTISSSSSSSTILRGVHGSYSWQYG